jgi:hypothetical protein
MRKKVLMSVAVLLCSLLVVDGLHADGDFDNELNEFMMTYHQKPAPDRVPKFLEIVTQEKFLSRFDKDESDILVVGLAHSFGHMARGQTKLVRLFEKRFETAEKRGRAFLLTSLLLCGDEQTVNQLDIWHKDPTYREQNKKIEEIRHFLADPKRKLPRDLPVKTHRDVSVLWADFFVTGDYAPVARILDVLDRPDELRPLLEKILKNHPDKKKQLDDVLTEIGLVKPGTQDQWIDGNLELALTYAGFARLAKYLNAENNKVTPQEWDSLELQWIVRIDFLIQLNEGPALVKCLKAHVRQRPAPRREIITTWLRDQWVDRATAEIARYCGGIWKHVRSHWVLDFLLGKE